MTVLTREQAEALFPEVFGAGAPPAACDGCDVTFGPDIPSVSRPYGPFTIHLCPRCDWKRKKLEFRKRHER